jgi:mono/diheme cytochrome c family protein
MRRILKYLGIFLGIVLAVIVVLAIVVFFISNSELNKTVEVEIASVEIPEPDDDVLARGEYLARHVGVCMECHGPTLAGSNLIDVPIFAVVNPPNLTSGEGGTADFTDEDFVRAIRHGVGPDGKRLLIMPSSDYARFSEEDLGAVIAYVQSLPPQDTEVGGHSLVIARAMLAMAPSDFLEYENIDHSAPLPPAIEEGVTAEYGEYLAGIACAGCHGESYSGKSIPGAGITSVNLTPGGPLADYTLDDFRTVFSEGIAMDGREISDDDMPWAAFGGMTEDDLEAVFIFLQSLDALEDEEVPE